MNKANDNSAVAAIAAKMDRIAVAAYEDCQEIAGKLVDLTLAALHRRFAEDGSVYGLAVEAVRAEYLFRRDRPDEEGDPA